MDDNTSTFSQAVEQTAQTGTNRTPQQSLILLSNNNGLLTNNNNVTNLIATHQNNIAHKSKIMILAPASEASSSTTTTATTLSGPTGLPANLVHQVIRSSGSNSSTSNMVNLGAVSKTNSPQNATFQHFNSGSFNLKSQPVQTMATPCSPSKIFQAAGSNQISRATISYPISSLASTNLTSNRLSHEYSSNINSPTVAAYSSTDDDKTNGHNSVIVQNNLTEIESASNSNKQKINVDLETEYERQSRRSTRVKQDRNILDNDEMDISNEIKGYSDSSNIVSYDPKIFSDETLDRSSPELWPEAVPGVIKFIANTSPNIEFEDDDEQSHDKTNDHFFANSKADEVEAEESVQLLNPSQGLPKLVKSFAMTPYGLESTSVLSSSAQLNDSRDCSSLHESRCGSPTSSESSCSAVSTSNKTGSVSSSKPAPKVYQVTNKETNVPAWQRDLDEDEIAMVYGYGSLTPSSLMDKIKEIQNLAYQLGLEEEREMMRARYLNILNQPNQSTDCYPKVALEPELDSLISREFTPSETSGSQGLV